ncbi:MAG: protein kinase [Rubripirellula sp.]
MPEAQRLDLTRNDQSLTLANSSEELLEIPDRVGSYKILDRLGAGGFSIVYSARDTRDDSVVALKLLRRNNVADSDREASTVQKLVHSSIVQVIQWGIYSEDRLYIAMELVKGSSLRAAMADPGFTQVDAAGLIAVVARALHHAHNHGFVHRDIKPENILIDQDGQPKLTDFGLAIHDEDQWGHRYQLAGTLSYMAPEQVRRESHRLDGRADVWALGVVLYEILLGQRPFRNSTESQLKDEILYRQPKPLRQIDDNICPQLERICLRCMSKQMTDRYSTALDLACDLEHWIAAQSSRSSNAVDGSTPGQAVVIPRGLRSFSADDHQFFLRLLPGPRHGDGTPEQIRFWTDHLRNRQSNETFPVGLIYGPSGCGKSSFVQAGLLPRVTDATFAMFMESTSAGTALRLKKQLAQQFDYVDSDDSVSEAMRKVRVHAKGQRKVLIVLDQFEQHLHGSEGDTDTELVEALRHCDGGNLQCLLIVRDDFWMSISDFMKRLEVPQVEGMNIGSVPLFSMTHANAVLTEFGRAYGQLPSEMLTELQQQFVAQAVEALTDEGYVVCLRLALFAHLMRQRQWVPETLKQVGGLRGLGICFLEESFCSPDAPPQRRKHFDAACKVLSSLMTGPSESIKGERKTKAELCAASGYGSNPPEFEALLGILDSELRLITPIVEHDEPENPDFDPSDHRADYQLSHDFLVPSLRDWLELRDQSSSRGRARTLLAQRERHWALRPENRQLPSLWESFQISLWTKWSSWTKPQAAMMRKAVVLHASHLIGILLPVLLIAIAFTTYRDRSARLAALFECRPEALDAAVADIVAKPAFLRPMLQSRVDAEELPIELRARAAIALAAMGNPRSDFLISHAADVPVSARPSVVTALRSDTLAVDLVQDHFERIVSAASFASVDRKSTLANLALNLDAHSIAVSVTRPSSDPISRTRFIHEFPDWACRLDAILDQTQDHPDACLHASLCIGLGLLADTLQDVPAAVRKRIHKYLVAGFQNSPDAATHSACAFALRRWGNSLPSLPSTLSQRSGVQTQSWISTPSDVTLVKIPAIDSFWLSSEEVSRSLFSEFVKDSDEREFDFVDERVSPSGSHPANSVSWVDAIEFLNWLSKRDGLPPYYEKVKYSWQVIDTAGTGYRLPRQDEWEYACRAGARTVYYYGDDPALLDQYATYGDSLHTSTCGSNIPNAWGLFDMSGNVWEWCDHSVDEHDGSRDPEVALICGGGYDNPAQVQRCDNQVQLNRYERFNGIGFRIARN